MGRRKLTTAEIDNREAAVFAGCVTSLLEWTPVYPIPGLSPALHQMLTADISPRHHWFLREMAPEKRAQKFHFDDSSLPNYYPTTLVLQINRAAWEIYLSL